jgi:hypothetical protein
MKLFSIGKKKWGVLSKTAQTTTVAKPHGLKGVANRSKGFQDRLAAVNAHLDELCDLGEPVATRIVREVFGLMELQSTCRW